MEQNSFFKPRDGVTLSELAQYLGAELPDASKAGRSLSSPNISGQNFPMHQRQM